MPKQIKPKSRIVSPYDIPPKTNAKQLIPLNPIECTMSQQDGKCAKGDKSKKNQPQTVQADAALSLIGVSPDPNNELKELLLSIKREQVTKIDLNNFASKISQKLDGMDDRINTQADSIDDMNVRLTACESLVESATYSIEMDKQRQLKNNLSIAGLPQSKENLKEVVLRLFTKMDVQIADGDIIDAYRVKAGNTVIVKLSNFTTKQNLLSVKSKSQLSACDIMTTMPLDKSVIYINNHTTPYFGKILQEGRKMVKEKQIFSCWLNANGCQVKILSDSTPTTVQNIGQMHAMLEGAKTEIQTGKRRRNQEMELSPETKRPQPKKK